MDQHPNISINEALIGRYLAGESSPEEAIAVDEWLDQSRENRLQFEALVTLWEQASPGNSYQAPDDATAWQQLKAGINLPEKAPTRNLFSRPFTIAAAILVLLGAGLGSYFFLNRTTITPPAGVITAGAYIRTETLPDQSVITLTKNSRLTIAPGFATESRQVTLEGEGYFSVKHQEGNTFTIVAGELKIEVVGTEFNVNEDTADITVGVKQGLVRLSAGAGNLMVPAGATGIYNRQTKELKLWDSVVRNNFAYATRELYFYDTPMRDVKLALEAAYGVKIIFENSKLAQCRLNTQFNHQSMQQIMEVIAASLGIHYRIEQQTIYISGDECR